jgi:hypothetical protein
MQDRFSKEVTGMLSSGVLIFMDRILCRKAPLPLKKTEPKHRRKTHAHRYGQVPTDIARHPSPSSLLTQSRAALKNVARWGKKNRAIGLLVSPFLKKKKYRKRPSITNLLVFPLALS